MEKGSTLDAQMAARPKPFGHQRFPAKMDGAFMEPSGRNRGASGGNRDSLENRSNKPIRNQWQPTATVSERMVKSMFATACQRLPTIPFLLERESTSRLRKGI